jgi:hypothetical protein
MTMRLLRLLWVLALVVLGTAGSAMAIVGGQQDGSAHPYVGEVRDGHTICSGALVSRTVFLTAAHCFVDSQSIFGTSSDGHQIVEINFDPIGLKNPARVNFYGPVYNDPTFCGGCGKGVAGFSFHDLAVVVLPAPVPASIVPRLASLPTSGQSEALRKQDALVDVVGYGIQGFTGKGKDAQPSTAGTRAWATVRLKHATNKATETLLKEDSPGAIGPCSGDSGGPALLTGTDTILGVVSFLTDDLCKGAAYATRLDTPDTLGFVNSFLH